MGLFLMYNFMLSLLIILLVFLFYLLEVSLWVLLVNSLMAMLLFIFNLNLLFNWKVSVMLCINSFKKFLIYYIILETMTEMLFLIGYVFHSNIFYTLFFIFKLGVYPFIHYSYLMTSLNFKKVFVSILMGVYFLMSKVWALILMSWIPLNYQTISLVVLGALIYLAFHFDVDFKELFFSSLMLSSVNLMLMVMVFSMEISFFYLMMSTMLQFKSFNLLHGGGYFKECFMITIFFNILNGNPLFLFNLLKIVVGVFLSGLNTLLSVFYLAISILFLTLSSYKVFILNFKSSGCVFKKYNQGEPLLLTGVFLSPMLLIIIFLNSIFLNVDFLMFIIGFNVL